MALETWETAVVRAGTIIIGLATARLCDGLGFVAQQWSEAHRMWRGYAWMPAPVSPRYALMIDLSHQPGSVNEGAVAAARTIGLGQQLLARNTAR